MHPHPSRDPSPHISVKFALCCLFPFEVTVPFPVFYCSFLCCLLQVSIVISTSRSHLTSAICLGTWGAFFPFMWRPILTSTSFPCTPMLLPVSPIALSVKSYFNCKGSPPVILSLSHYLLVFKGLCFFAHLWSHVFQSLRLSRTVVPWHTIFGHP